MSKPIDRFYKNTVALCDLVYELIVTAYNEGFKILNPDMVLLACKLLINFDKTQILENFIFYSYPLEGNEMGSHWDELIARNENFFLNHSDRIFSDMPLDNVNAFKTLFDAKKSNKEAVVALEDRESIKDYFISYIKICLHYIHEGRKPYLNEKQEQCYRDPSFFEKVDLLKYATKLQVKLFFN